MKRPFVLGAIAVGLVVPTLGSTPVLAKGASNPNDAGKADREKDRKACTDAGGTWIEDFGTSSYSCSYDKTRTVRVCDEKTGRCVTKPWKAPAPSTAPPIKASKNSTAQ